MSAEPTTQNASRRTLDQYELVAEIASGGMGTVYLARLARAGGFQRMVALKLLHRHLADEPGFVAMLLDEARLAARLHHPNAVGIYDVRESALGYYLVMDYVDGFSLDEVLDNARDEDERMRLGLRVLLDGATGLDAAHRLNDDEGKPLNIVHRDVSPQNILVGKDGVGRITDFGVARAAARITSSRPGTIKGKPCYMAPEQAQGQHLDARADVFALGIVLWEVLTGQLLFESEEGTATVLLAVLQREIKPPSHFNPNVPPELDEVCLNALRRPVEERYDSARAFCAALQRAAAATGWLADAHEVSDALGAIFEDRLAARKASLRKHLSEVDRLPAAPMTPADLFSVPKLGSSEHQAMSGVEAVSQGGWHETPAPHDAPTRQGMRARVDATSRTVRADSVHAPGPIDAPAVAASEASRTKSGPPWRLVALVLATGLAIATFAAWTLMGRTPEPATTATAQSAQPEQPAATPAAAAPQAELPTADATPTEAEVVAPEAAAPTTPPEGAEPPAEAAPTEPAAPAPASTRRSSRRSRRASMAAEMAAPAPAPMAAEMAAPMAPRAPAIEANPYAR